MDLSQTDGSIANSEGEKKLFNVTNRLKKQIAFAHI